MSHKAEGKPIFHDFTTEDIEKLRQCSAFTMTLNKDVQLKNKLIAELQTAVSDLQNYLYQEREQLLKVIEENERLKLSKAKDRKNIDILLTLSGKTMNNIPAFRINTDDAQMLTRLCQNNKSSGKNAAALDNSTKKEQVFEDTVTVKFEKENATHCKAYIETLLSDREIIIQERAEEREVLENHIDILTLQLQDTHDQLYHVKNELSLSQKELKKCKENLNTNFMRNQNIDKTLQDENKFLKTQLVQRDELTMRLQEQKEYLQGIILKLKNEAKEITIQHREKVDKQTNRIAQLKYKCIALENRRLLEAEGFRSDIKILREKLKEVEKQIMKIAGTSHKLP